MDEQLTNTKTPQQLRIGTAIFFFISGFGYSTWASRIPTIQHRLHLNDAQWGLVLLALPVGLMLTMPLSSKLLSKYSSRGIMLFGSIALCIILTMMGVSYTTWELVLFLFCFGSARNMLTLSINTHAVAVQALHGRSIMVTFHGVWSMAGFAGAGVGYLMVLFNVAPDYHFMFASIVLLCLTLYFIKDTLYKAPVPQPKKAIFSLPDKYLLNFSLICFACMACENTMYDWAALYFQKVVHTQQNVVTAAFVIYMVSVTAGRIFGDRLVTKVGIKQVLKYSGVFIFAGLALAVGLPYPITAGFGFVLVGLGVSCVVPMLFSLAGRSKHMSSSSAIASISTIGYLGFLFVPPFVGIVAHATSLRLSFGIIALFGAVMVYLVSKIKDDAAHDHIETVTEM